MLAYYQDESLSPPSSEGVAQETKSAQNLNRSYALAYTDNLEIFTKIVNAEIYPFEEGKILFNLFSSLTSARIFPGNALNQLDAILHKYGSTLKKNPPEWIAEHIWGKITSREAAQLFKKHGFSTINGIDILSLALEKQIQAFVSNEGPSDTYWKIVILSELNNGSFTLFGETVQSQPGAIPAKVLELARERNAAAPFFL